jgi:hypothetical protein
MNQPPEAPRLRSLANHAAPPELVTDLCLVASFPPAAQQALWSVLGPCLSEPVPPRIGRALDDFAATHGLEGATLARAVRACRTLVRGAAFADLNGAAFADEVKQVLGADSVVVELLLRGYAAGKTQIRDIASRAAMAQHGRTLEGVDWRLDHVVGSSAGGRLRFPVMVVTLRCRDRGQPELITFQATPAALRELQVLCDSLLGPGGGKP